MWVCVSFTKIIKPLFCNRSYHQITRASAALGLDNFQGKIGPVATLLLVAEPACCSDSFVEARNRKETESGLPPLPFQSTQSDDASNSMRE